MMTDCGPHDWDARYEEGDWVDVGAPADIVVEAAPWLGRPGVALDVAAGAGRNALHLARAGWRVLGVDLSSAGLRLMAERARAERLRVMPVQADLGRFQVAPAAFDLVVNTHFLLRAAFPLLRGALRPGGLLLFETWSVIELDELGGDLSREFTLERGELLRAFGGLDVLLHQEGVFQHPEGERGLARLIARKPPSAR